ncbi:MAG TPA: DNA mismatch repair protein MutT [Candidatus Cloacimonas sp.]|jgi:8-oxo-dGTP diphosphatase|nr:8-oxo-dGTP diphosphatase [Candidatus Cloacimonadota bacterium]HCX72364.1 DNA mismatch repair protein MutT [Candidatus Cloacimonas sp.]
MTILATLCYLQKNGRTLMLFRNKKENDIHQGKYNGLGGKFESGESPEECARREIKEESGLTAQVLNLKGVICFPNFDGSNDWYVFVFCVPKFKGKLIESPEGKLEWIDNSKLNKIPLWKGDYIFIPWLGKNNFFSAKFCYEKGELKSHTVEFY